MFELEIPGSAALCAEYLVLDLNGTLAVDGTLIEGVKERLDELSHLLSIVVVTADTFGAVRRELAGVPCKIEVLSHGNQDEKKGELIDRLGAGKCIAIGNGRNDCVMLRKAALGICVVQGEGAASKAMLAADVVCGGVHDAFDLIRFPKRLVATLRT